MREQVQKALEVLIGKPLWSSGRAADLEWFQFGQRRTINTRNHTKEVGEYALHVQCAWRITYGDEVVVGNHDLYYPPEETADRPEDFNWEPLGSNRRDKRIAALFQGETRQFLVRRIQVSEAGRFRMLLIMTMLLMCFLMIRSAMNTGRYLSRTSKDRTSLSLVKDWKRDSLAALCNVAVVTSR